MLLSCLPQVAALRSYHYKAQTQPDQQVCAQFGLDLVEGRVRNNVEEGVLEPAMSKIKMIQVGRMVGDVRAREARRLVMATFVREQGLNGGVFIGCYAKRKCGILARRCNGAW